MRFDQVWLRYGRRSRWVLEDVNVDLPTGRVAVVAGANGAGKSTLLAAAAGLLRPGRGVIRDRPRRVGWVPERFPANQPFTARAYLIRMGRVRGLSPAAAARATDEWAQRLNLTHYLDVKLPELSKGTAQKVGLAQALLCPPELLVLDEPWEGLDAQTRNAVPEIVGMVLAAGGRVLISDHLGAADRLPGAQSWAVARGQVSPVDDPLAAPAVIEVAVPAGLVEATIARLRGEGLDVLGVRIP